MSVNGVNFSEEESVQSPPTAYGVSEAGTDRGLYGLLIRYKLATTIQEGRRILFGILIFLIVVIVTASYFSFPTTPTVKDFSHYDHFPPQQ